MIALALLLTACSASRPQAEPPRPPSHPETITDAGADPMDDMSWLGSNGSQPSKRSFLQLSTDELRNDLARLRGFPVDRVVQVRARQLENVPDVEGLVLALHRWGKQPSELRGWLVSYSPCTKARRPCPSVPVNLGPAVLVRALALVDLRAKRTDVALKRISRRALSSKTGTAERPVVLIHTERYDHDGSRVEELRVVSLERPDENATLLVVHDAQEVVSLWFETRENEPPEVTISREPRPCDRCAPRPLLNRYRLEEKVNVFRPFSEL